MAWNSIFVFSQQFESVKYILNSQTVQKRATGQIWAMGQSLLIPGLERKFTSCLQYSLFVQSAEKGRLYSASKWKDGD